MPQGIENDLCKTHIFPRAVFFEGHRQNQPAFLPHFRTSVLLHKITRILELPYIRLLRFIERGLAEPDFLRSSPMVATSIIRSQIKRSLSTLGIMFSNEQS